MRDWGFYAATLAPALLIGAAATAGGVWVWLALAWMTVAVALLDALAARRAAATEDGAEFPAGRRLSVALALAHAVLLPLGVAAVSGATGLGWAQRGGLFLALGLWLGQVSNANAHELIHRPSAGLRRLGVAVFVSLLFGHHASAHPKVHHRWVGSRRDPNTARRGESFYRFLPRAWRGSFRAGWRAEGDLLRRRDGRTTPLRHPYAVYVGGGAACLTAAALAGWAALLAYLALCLHAQAQLLLSDYVQHYGLERLEDGNGRLEPVSAAHSWNAPHPASARMMLNAPRHSDHHAHPAREFGALTIPEDAPLLPASLPAMGALALWPAMWRRVMDPRVAAVAQSRRAA
jgi:alkane 1-monooxygenase